MNGAKTRSILILTVVLAPMAAVHADEVAPVTVYAALFSNASEMINVQ